MATARLSVKYAASVIHDRLVDWNDDDAAHLMKSDTHRCV